MADYLIGAVGALALINCILLIFVLRRRNGGSGPSADLLSHIEKWHERGERVVREEIARNRHDAENASRLARKELGEGLTNFGEALFGRMVNIANLQKGQLETFSNQLSTLIETNERKFEGVRQTLDAKLTQMAQEASDHAAKGREEDKRNFDGFCMSLVGRVTEIAGQQKQQLDDFAIALKGMAESSNASVSTMRDVIERKLGSMQAEAAQSHAANREEAGKNLKMFSEALLLQIAQLGTLQKQELERFSAAIAGLTQANEVKLESVRQTVETRLTALQTDNAAKLEAMRQTVDEKLHATLEQRLGESFKLVSERLELVHKGLGEMQSLATGVGDLKKVLTNIKTRGNWGEVQLGNLLEQMLTPDQYDVNVQVNPQSNERVEFAVKLPGRDGTGIPILLPIDAKFPQEDYQRLIDASDHGDGVAMAAYASALEERICSEARKIKEKYICAPYTTDFAILFLPTEGLFAEVLRRPGLCDGILRDHRVVLAGPTTLAAVLSSLQMGFRTLVIEKRSSEVWQVLGAVKAEFGKFGDVLEKVQKKLQEASNTVDRAATRSRVLERKLKGVQELPSEEAKTVMRIVGGDSIGSASVEENQGES